MTIDFTEKEIKALYQMIYGMNGYDILSSLVRHPDYKASDQQDLEIVHIFNKLDRIVNKKESS